MLGSSSGGRAKTATHPNAHPVVQKIFLSLSLSLCLPIASDSGGCDDHSKKFWSTVTAGRRLLADFPKRWGPTTVWLNSKKKRTLPSESWQPSSHGRFNPASNQRLDVVHDGGVVQLGGVGGLAQVGPPHVTPAEQNAN